MSFVISSAIADNQQRSNTVGQRLSDSDFILFFNDALNYFYTNLKLPTCQRKWSMIAYPSVTDYALPDDFIGIIEPQKPSGQGSPNFNHTTERAFRHWPYGRTTSIAWDREVAYLILNETTGSQTFVNQCDSLTDGGTWAVSGDGAGLFIDNQTMSQGEGSLAWTTTAAGGTTTLTCTNLSPVDLTNYIKLGKVFVDPGCPDSNTNPLTSVTLKLGSSAGDYYSMTATLRNKGSAILNGFGLVGFDFNSKTTVGVPVDTNIVYAQVILSHGLVGVNGIYHLDNIFLAQGSYYDIPYYSKNNVKDAAGVYKAKVTATDDTILCPDDLDLCISLKMLEIAAAIRLKDTGLASYFARELKPKENYLKSKYPRMESRNQTSYYKKVGRF